MIFPALRVLVPVALVIALVAIGLRIGDALGIGPDPAFTLLAGALFGVLLQRSRFCFYCILRELFEDRDSRASYGLLVALAVGSLGYVAMFGSWVADPGAGRLPPDAHIGPVSWVLVVAGLAFGIGMTLSGSCISAHLYRLGEGSVLSPFALVGALAGFVLGFASWDHLYVETISRAPTEWLPARFGYGGAVLLQLAVLGALALLLMRRLPARPARDAAAWRLRAVLDAVFVRRWPAWVGGAGVGMLGFIAYFRTSPLGVTAELGSRARTLAERLDLIPGRLAGLDGFSGCATVVIDALMTENGVFILALVAGSLAAAIGAGAFRPRRQPLHRYPLALLGGVLMGWGAMVALGCTVGVLLSGISAFALSGWVFGAAVVAGVWVSLAVRNRVRMRLSARHPAG